MKNILLSLFWILTCLIGNSQISFRIKEGTSDSKLKQKIESNTSRLLTQINVEYKMRSDSIHLDDQFITEKGKKNVSELWKEGHFFFCQSKLSENLNQKGTSFQIRNIPIIIERTDTLDVVIEFLADGKIDDFYIGLKQHQIKNILNGDKTVVDQTRREIILNFIENMRNYYIKKDTENISNLYSDKALIIVGKDLHRDENSNPNDHLTPNYTTNQVIYLTKTKKEYIKSLKEKFDNISYLQLDFKDIKIDKHNKFTDWYGVSLEQIWNSSNYNDDGFLFLMIQFRKADQPPLIWVRVWQDKDEFGMHNYTIRP